MGRFLAGLSAIVLIAVTQIALAADDPSIKGEERAAVKKAMKDHIKQNSLDESYVIYDAVQGDLKKLTFEELHEGIVRKGDFFVSCADLVDPNGKKYDIDFLVGEVGKSHMVLEAVVHSVNGKKRAYHLEEKKPTKPAAEQSKTSES